MDLLPLPRTPDVSVAVSGPGPAPTAPAANAGGGAGSTGSTSNTDTALTRTWQKNLVSRLAPAPLPTPWWEQLAGSRVAVAVGAFVLSLLLLAIINPPIVQQTSDTAFDAATLSIPRLLVWSALVGGLVLAAPYAWSALCGAGGGA